VTGEFVDRVDRELFSPGPGGTLLVQLAVLARGHPEPSVLRVGAAWIDLGAPRPCTVGEVADRLVERGHPLEPYGQGRLLA
jgi:hypothetical protein